MSSGQGRKRKHLASPRTGDYQPEGSCAVTVVTGSLGNRRSQDCCTSAWSLLEQPTQCLEQGAQRSPSWPCTASAPGRREQLFCPHCVPFFRLPGSWRRGLCPPPPVFTVKPRPRRPRAPQPTTAWPALTSSLDSSEQTSAELPVIGPGTRLKRGDLLWARTLLH